MKRDLYELYGICALFVVGAAITFTGVASTGGSSEGTKYSFNENNAGGLPELAACDGAYSITLAKVNPALLAYNEDSEEKRNQFADAAQEASVNYADLAKKTEPGDVASALDNLTKVFTEQVAELRKPDGDQGSHGLSINQIIVATDQVQDACLDIGFADRAPELVEEDAVEDQS